MQQKNKYIIITSAYNEAENIGKCIQSVLKQTIQPAEWIIIDNGSTDCTSNIIQQYQAKFPLIKLLFKTKEKSIVSGYHAINNFYYGMSMINTNSYDYICNLDADIVIDRNDYYEYQILKMQKDETIGITTGITYYYDKNGNKKMVRHHPWHTTGALKFYRKECFESLGIMHPDMGWDGADEMKAMCRGWKTITYYQLEVNHFGKIKDLNRKKSRDYHFNRGFSIYRRGYPLWYIIVKALQTILRNSFASSLSLIEGYSKGMFAKESRTLTKTEVKYLRRFHLVRLIKKLTGINSQKL